MAEARKYIIATEFAPDGAVLRARKALTPEEIEAQRAAAYERGKADAVAEAERRSAAAIEQLAKAAADVLEQLETERHAMRSEAAHVALIAARKIAGAALDAYGGDHAAAAIEAAMDALRAQPRLLVRLPGSAAKAVQPRIEAMRQAHAYSGAILVRADPKARIGDVAIDWSDGVVHLSADATAERIAALIDAVAARPEKSDEQ